MKDMSNIFASAFIFFICLSVKYIIFIINEGSTDPQMQIVCLWDVVVKHVFMLVRRSLNIETYTTMIT